MALFQKLAIFAIQPPHQEVSNFPHKPLKLNIQFLASFIKGYWRKQLLPKAKIKGKKEQKGKETVRRNRVLLFHL